MSQPQTEIFSTDRSAEESKPDSSKTAQEEAELEVENPLTALLPPALDPLTYLTLLSQYIPAHPETSLPLLLSILQDDQNREKRDLPGENGTSESLIESIGWDLVFLLLPYLEFGGSSDADSASENKTDYGEISKQCLLLVATSGNAREVLVKVAEALAVLDFGSSDREDGDEDEDQAEDSKVLKGGIEGNDNAIALLPLKQFTTLLQMLAILHARIKTKYPSRFLATSLSAVLKSYTRILVFASSYASESGKGKDREDVAETATEAVIRLVKSLIRLASAKSGVSGRPPLPPRKSTNDASSALSTPISSPIVTSPSTKAPIAVSDEDHVLQKRLLQAFTSSVLDLFLITSGLPDPATGNTGDEVDSPGLCWSGRMMEILFPALSVPGRVGWAERLDKVQALQSRTRVCGNIISLCGDYLSLYDSLDELFYAATGSLESDDNTILWDDDNPPEKLQDVNLSRTGALFLLIAKVMSEAGGQSESNQWQIPIFPKQASLIQSHIGMARTGGKASAGTEPEPVIDAIIALGLASVEANAIGEPVDDNSFFEYLQTISIVSANTPSASLRFNAHMLTTTVLRSHPSDVTRLNFITDTLNFCPFENLKVSAVGWIKGETLEANLPSTAESVDAKEDTVFSTAHALQTCGPYLFPDLSMELTAPSIQEAWVTFRANSSFYLATLNFYYLLLTARHLHTSLDIAGLHKAHDIGGSVVGPLRMSSQKFRKSLTNGELAKEESEDGIRAALLELQILDHTLEHVENGITELGKDG